MKLSNNSRIAAVCVRTSTTKQKEEKTVESQIAECKSKAEADGYIVPDELIFVDDGYSGELLERPGLDAMRDAAKDGKFGALYVYDRGRISRIFAYQEVVIEELSDLGIKFVPLHDIQATTPEEQVLQAMQGVFHQYERIKIAERMRRGKMYKAKNGVLISGMVPYGYLIQRDVLNKKKWVVIDNQAAEVVRQIFSWVAKERMSMYAVGNRLYDLGIHPPKNRQSRWAKSTIRRLLASEVYATGNLFYNKTQAVVAQNPTKHPKYRRLKRTSRRARLKEEWIAYKVPVLLDEPWMWEKAQKVIQDNGKYAPKNCTYEYLLSGLVYCECGKRRTGDGASTTGHRYYRCIERLLRADQRQCDSQGVNAIILDKMLWNKLAQKITDKKFLRLQATKWLRNREKAVIGDGSVVKGMEKALGNIVQEELRYGRAYGEGVMDYAQFSDLMRDLKRRKRQLSDKLASYNIGDTRATKGYDDPKIIDMLCAGTSEYLKGTRVQN